MTTFFRDLNMWILLFYNHRFYTIAVAVGKRNEVSIFDYVLVKRLSSCLPALVKRLRPGRSVFVKLLLKTGNQTDVAAQLQTSKWFLSQWYWCLVNTAAEEKVILVSENDLFFTLGLGTSNARNENLRPLLDTNIPLISGNYGLRNHFWPLEIRFLMRKNEKKSIFSKPPQCPILSFWILNLHIIICQFKKKSTKIHFFCLSPCSCH